MLRERIGAIQLIFNSPEKGMSSPTRQKRHRRQMILLIYEGKKYKERISALR